ncbi:histidine kinase dimerization/phospho-acceptor domain-containing protein [Empedobacter brevis]|uniref:histidine kinase dimerization/phospho-acceptor domain-containing protein n=1 Tax=Empedobacter brevis TaxID=247 RepID=UPI0039AF7A8E
MFKKLSVKNRIALFYSLAFSVVLLVIFYLIYFSVNRGINKTMYETLEEEINSHIEYVLHEPTLENYVQPREWEEVEHTDIALNPVFISIYDKDFNLIESSPNLVQNKLDWNKEEAEKKPFYAEYNSIQLLISQAKLIHHGEIVGYIVVGISTKHNQLALDYLKTALLLIFPISVLLTFIFARFIASKSIKPLFNVIHTAQSITENNLSERIALPKNKDELFQLSTTINSLLDRLEFQIVKAKQFSADASHELRTPLAIIKGTLEILIRRERSPEQYNKKIDYTLKQVKRLDRLVEQFLLLSRVENNSLELKTSLFEVKSEVLKSIERFDVLLQEKEISISTDQLQIYEIENYQAFFEIIIDNILSNAIKYSNLQGEINICSKIENNSYNLIFEDNGIGMNDEDLKFVQERFFRIKNDSTFNISGSGLGLNIASQLAKLSAIEMRIESKHNVGTKIILSLNNK